MTLYRLPGSKVFGQPSIPRPVFFQKGALAFRALALDVAVGQEHPLDRVEELLDRLGRDEAGFFQGGEYLAGELPVLGRVGRVEVVETHPEAREIALVRLRHARDELLGLDALGLRLEHDRRAMGVVGAHEVNLVPLQPLEPHPDVGLGVLHDVADVEGAVGVGKRRRDEKLAGHEAGWRA